MGACISGCVTCATYIHDRCFDLRWRDLDGSEFVEIAQMRMSTVTPQKKSIHVAVVDKNEEDIRQILRENPAAGTEENASGETPLHQACRLGYIHIVHVLLECGCLAGVVTNLGTAFNCVIKAAQTGYTNEEQSVHLIRLLAGAGCDVNKVDRGRKTPLFCAIEQGNLGAADALVTLGADVNIAECNNFTPLYMAVIRCDLRCVRYLLNCPQIDINAQDDTGRTPLIAALITITNNFRYERMPNDIYNMGGIPESTLATDRFSRIAIVEALLSAGLYFAKVLRYIQVICDNHYFS